MVKSFQHHKIDAQLTWAIMKEVFARRWPLVVGLFVVVLFILQWLFNLQELRFIWTGDNNLSLFDRIDFMIDGFFNILRYSNGIVPASMITIAILQAFAITTYRELRLISNEKAETKRQLGSLGLGLLGSGCVACGGSVLTPLLSIVATNVSISVAERIGDALLLIAVVLSYRALVRLSLLYAQIKHS